MNLLKKESLLLCIALYCGILQAMEKETAPTKEQLVQAVTTRNIEALENLLPSFATNFTLLAQIYVYTVTEAKKLIPNEGLRRKPSWQGTIHKIQLRRKTALDTLIQLDQKEIPKEKEQTYKTLFKITQEQISSEKTRKEQIDETLIDQGQLSFICAKKIHSYLELLVPEESDINFLYLLIGHAGDLALLQDFVAQYEKFINWDYCDIFGRTSLHVAAKEDNISIINYLLTKKTECNRQTYYEGKKKQLHKTPLHYAVEHGQINAIKYLLHHGSNPNIADYFGNSPLHYVAPGPKGNKEIFEMLLSANANIDSADKTGKTLLYQAVEANNPDIVNYLLELGANPNFTQKNNLNSTLKDLESPAELALTQAIDNMFNHDEISSKKSIYIISLLSEYSFKEIHS